MNAEKDVEEVTKEKPKSKRLSSLIWILVLWGALRLYSELHPIHWTYLFLYSAIGLGLFPASVALFISMGMKDIAHQKYFRWGAFLILLVSPCLGFLMEKFGIANVRLVCVFAHWFLLVAVIGAVFLTTFNQGDKYER